MRTLYMLERQYDGRERIILAHVSSQADLDYVMRLSDTANFVRWSCRDEWAEQINREMGIEKVVRVRANWHKEGF